MSFEHIRAQVTAGKESFQAVNTAEVATKIDELKLAIDGARQKVADALAELSHVADGAMSEFGALMVQNSANASEGAQLILEATDGASSQNATAVRAAAINGKASTEAILQYSGVFVKQLPEVIDALSGTQEQLESLTNQANVLGQTSDTQVTNVAEAIQQAENYSSSI